MRRRWIPVALVVAALVAVGMSAQGTGVHWGEREAIWEFETREAEEGFSMEFENEMPAEPPPTGEAGGSSIPSWVSWLLLSILVGIPIVLVLVLLARRLVWWLIDAEPLSPLPEVEPQYLRRDVTLVEQAVQAGLDEIDLGTDPRGAIIASWVHFERASEAVGIPRDASDTPADLVRKLLEHHELEGSSLRRLSGAYLRARYSPHEVGESDRDQARDALIDLQRQLGVREAR